MIRNNKLKYAVSTAITLLPAILTLIFWIPISNQLDKSFIAIGGGGGKLTFVIFSIIFPVFLALLNTGLLILTGLDKRALEQNEKVKNIVYFILPLISIFVAGLNFSILFYNEFNPAVLVFALISVMFTVIGNYMPKTKQNAYFGVKIRWTLANKENWEKTHRFAGKLWFIGGIISFPCMFLPELIGFIVLFAILLAMIVPVPIYSYLVYKKHIESGAYTKEDYSYNMAKKPLIVTLVAILLLIPVLCIVTFTGTVEATLTDTTLEVSATYWSDLSVNFSDIESIEYRENGVDGRRISGYGSPRMQLGWFTNDEFGNYTRYTLGGDNPCIVIKDKNGAYLVIGLETVEETKALYDDITQKVVFD